MIVAYQILKDSSYICIPCARLMKPFKGGPDNVLPIFTQEVSGTKLKCAICRTKLSEVEAILKAKPALEEKEEAPIPKKRGRPAKK